MGNLPNLITLNASHNNVKDMKSFSDPEKFVNIKYLDLSNNKVVELVPMKSAFLLTINLNFNHINKTESFEGPPKLRKLELRSN